MGKRYLRGLFLIGLFFLFSGCGGSTRSDTETQEQSIDQVEEDTVIFEPGVVTVIPADEQVPIIFDDSDFGILWPGGSPLSTHYDEYFSGYWRGTLCGNSGFAIIGVNGTSAEVNLGASFIDPMFGSVSSNGELLFSSREVNWDCEDCGEVRPLETTGLLDWDLGSGSAHFEVACRDGNDHTVSSIYVRLKEGKTQPNPYNELVRIKNDAVALIGDSPSCSENLHCKLISLESDDFCKFDALAYSVLDSDADALLELQREYSFTEWLARGHRGSSTTMCGYVKKAACEENKCISLPSP